MGLLPSISRAQYLLQDVQDPKRYELGTMVVPVAFYSTEWAAAGGVAGYTDGLFQPQVQEYEFLVGTSNGSYAGVVGLSDLQLRPIDRLFFDFDLSYVRTRHDENNIARIPGPADSGAGRPINFNFVRSASNDFIGDFTFKYLLPIGSGKSTLIDVYHLRDGLLDSGASGGDEFNPFHSGRTFLELTPQFEYMDIRSPFAQRQEWDTDSLQFAVVYDNRDWPLTPSRGDLTTLSITRDFGAFGSSNPWTNVTGEFSKYISLGTSSLFRQDVLALDGWTSYSPTWHQRGPTGNPSVSDAPPFYDGASLGGMQKMRAFAEARFHDRAGIYGSAELRVIPYWNPFSKIALFKPADIAWIQLVAFAEVGKVADEYTFSKLFTQMKTDGGIGLRVMTQDTVVRFDLAVSGNNFQFWANLGQAF